MRGYSSSGRAAGSQSAGGGFESHWLQELNGTLYGVPFLKAYSCKLGFKLLQLLVNALN